MNFEELDKFIDGLPDKQSSLIAVLHHAQGMYGCLTNETQNHIAEKLELPAAKVYGVVTFYSFFRTKPKGKYEINVCLGTACFVRGADQVLNAFKEELKINSGETTEDGMFTLDSIRCVGACSLAPVVTVNDKVLGRVKPSDIKSIVEKCLTGGIDDE